MEDYFVPLFESPFDYKPLKVNYHKPHTYRVEIWIRHICAYVKEFKKKRVCISWLKHSYFSSLYDSGGCMIYIFLDKYKDSLVYYRFIDGFVELR